MANLIKITTDGTSVTGTAQTITTSSIIRANSLSPGNIIEVITSIKKLVGTTTTVSIRLYLNTANNLTGATQIGLATPGAGAPIGFFFGRNYIIKSTTSTIGYTSTTSQIPVDAPLSVAYSDFNIDWTVDQYLIVALSNSAGTTNDSYSTSLLVLKR